MSSTGSITASSLPSKPNLDVKPGKVTAFVFIGVVLGCLLYTGFSLMNDVNDTGANTTTLLPFILLGVALLIALGFEFVNGFSRYRQRGSHSYLYSLIATNIRGRLVRFL
jgi:PiT family inorganic phosphate transporter